MNGLSSIPKAHRKLQHSGHQLYNVALIGLGHRGYKTFFTCLQGKSFNIVAVCDTNTATIVNFTNNHPSVPAYSSIEALLGDFRPHFAIICVPHQYHMQCVVSCANVGIPVLKEKPVAESSECFRKLFCMPIKIGVTLQKRFEPRFIQFKSLLASVGKIASIRAVLAMNIEDLSSSWRASEGVGATEDLGCHILDIVVWMLGKPDSLMACRVDSVRSPPECAGDDVSIVMLRWQSNAVGHVYISRIAHCAEESLAVTGTKGTLILNGNRITHLDLRGNQTFEVTNEPKKDSIVQTMCHEFGDYVTGRTESYSCALTDFTDTMATIEAVKRTFTTLQVEKVHPIISNILTTINGHLLENGKADLSSLYATKIHLFPKILY